MAIVELTNCERHAVDAARRDYGGDAATIGQPGTSAWRLHAELRANGVALYLNNPWYRFNRLR